jgi:hypothetical protein
MFQLINSMTTSELFKRQLPMFLIALAIAEFFYKFKSFALECIAFLATWYVLDFIVYRLFPAAGSGSTAEPPR